MMRMFKTTAGGMAIAGLVLAAACGNELDGEAVRDVVVVPELEDDRMVTVIRLSAREGVTAAG